MSMKNNKAHTRNILKKNYKQFKKKKKQKAQCSTNVLLHWRPKELSKPNDTIHSLNCKNKIKY